MSNYPCGMSYEDLVYVGEISDPDDYTDWFEYSVNDEGFEEILSLWDEFREACDDESYSFNDYGAAHFMQEMHPEYWSGYEPWKKAA